MCIVLCSKGYPEKYNKNIEIKNLNESESSEKNYIFHENNLFCSNMHVLSSGPVLDRLKCKTDPRHDLKSQK